MDKNAIYMASKNNIKYLLLFILTGSLLFSGCNYNYYQGKRLEKEGRHEEANIEYHRAYTGSPNNSRYREAFERTAVNTAEDLLERYERYIKEKKYAMAYRRLEQARALTPDNPKIQRETKKWYRVLLAGRVDLVNIKSLRNSLPLSDKVEFTVRINTPVAEKTLEALVDNKNRTFNVEDILYDPPQDLLMLYSLNSIGVKLINASTGRELFQKFIDFKIPIPLSIEGNLASRTEKELQSVEESFPFDELSKNSRQIFIYPSRENHYSLLLGGESIEVETIDGRIEYLPQMLYVNGEDRRYFLDFGHYELSQPGSTNSTWAYRRVVTERRDYLRDLRKNLMLNAYFYYRDGAYPYLVMR